MGALMALVVQWWRLWQEVETFKPKLTLRIWRKLGSSFSPVNEVSNELKLVQVVDSEEMERDSLLEKMEHADNPSLREMLHQYLQGRQYLIVLDDLPKRIRLQSILGALPYEDKKSRLVFTSHTTSANVRIMDHEVYDMEFLDSKKSWKLFLQTINRGNKLGGEYNFPKELEKQGREMLTKYCCGLPLAIKEVGKQLAKKRCLGSEWEELLQQPIDLGTTLEKLDPFYHKLDEEVKPCFLQMAFYKENITMREEKMEQIWSAKGGEGSAHREDFRLKNLPDGIGTLIELRYLGLRNNHIQELPDWLGRLKKLEVLDIAQNFMMEVPDIIWEMRSLRHLYLSHVICRKPLKIDALQNLETLTYISVDNWTYGLSGLKMLYRLRKLGIEEMNGNTDVSKLFASLTQLRNLKNLILKGFRFRSMPCLDKLGILQNLQTLKLDGLLARLPNSFPSNLESLKLVNSCLEEDPMPLLEKLPKLKHLKLRNAYTGQEMVIVYEYIPSLEVMCIEELWNLRNVRVENGLALSLKQLEIKNCPNLETLPESIRYVGGLKMVTTKIIATKIRRSGISSNMRVVDINP
ncbi:probable disease resistance protein At1g58390 [Salvia miltiorrhiza]|uniref:probable disease resistance protein At1g58390 n=1 Tax=Salvia miltiorrhiza TaxID=226208 RepID=UPI0025ACE0CB|nr:probable disease resistance protein At1g58390 [Salvia miltiorrhiza]